MHLSKEGAVMLQGDYCACQDILPGESVPLLVTGTPDGTTTILKCVSCGRRVGVAATDVWEAYPVMA